MSARRLLGLGLALSFAACTSGPKKELPPEKEDVRSIIMSHVGDVSDCYVTALKKNPKLAGKLVLQWEVNPIGDPKNIQVIQAVDPKMDKCIVGKLQSWAFPPPPGDQVPRIRYPFTFSPATPQDPVGNMKVQFIDPLPPVAPVGKKCPVVESEYAQLCVRDEKTKECVLDDVQMTQMLRLLQDSAKLPVAYLADLDRMLKNPKPTDAETKTIQAKLTEDCWSSIHERMWKSILHTFSVTAGHPRLTEAKEVMRQRVTEMEIPTPTYAGLQSDLVILEEAEKSGFLKISGAAKKELTSVRAKAKKLSQEFGGGSAIENEPAKLIVAARKELKSVKPVRIELRNWSKKFWKKI